ncbi:MAG: proline--tRNA ligase [Alicyclobacillaceae bacterium]|nr:proline--tRNA ligase [Alicyclobacillaceae bacterium]
MRMSNSLFKTQRDAPAEALLISHQLLVRAGFIRQISSGIYSLTPLAFCALQKISSVARQEMSRIGGQEVLLPVVQPSSLWKQSGRYEQLDASLARFQDRNGQRMVLAMTHEEAATDLVRHFVSSYRQLPMLIYQIQTKFRDEARPRGGLVRLREFMMKDAYSFHADPADLSSFYTRMVDAYHRFFQRCGVRAICVHADTGMMGGGASHEFMVLSPSGEDTIVLCNVCGYAANREVAVAKKSPLQFSEETLENPEWLHYSCPDGTSILAGKPASSSISEVKLARVLGVGEFLKTPEGGAEQFLSLESNWPNLYECESNQVTIALDDSFEMYGKSYPKQYVLADILSVEQGDSCPHCGNPLEISRAIEAGNIFQLGTQYTSPMHANFSGMDGNSQPLWMGCYGIGMSRMLACVIEENHDAKGIVFPESIAPFPYHLVTVGRNADVIAAAERIYESLGSEHVLFDDRDVHAGVKFIDADLLGLPDRITVSKRTVETGQVECRNRKTGNSTFISIDELGASAHRL